MQRKKMIEIRNLFYKMALLGFIVMLAGLAFTAAFPRFLAWWCMFLFGADDIPQTLIILFGMLKTLVITIFLIPALAIHWQYRK